MGNEVRDWSLVTGRGGGGNKREGGEGQVLSLEKKGGGGRKTSLRHAEGFQVVLK